MVLVKIPERASTKDASRELLRWAYKLVSPAIYIQYSYLIYLGTAVQLYERIYDSGFDPSVFSKNQNSHIHLAGTVIQNLVFHKSFSTKYQFTLYLRYFSIGTLL